MGFLIDSGVFIELERRKLSPESIARVAPQDSDEGDSTAISSITVSELLAGMHRAGDVTRQAERGVFVERVLSSVSVIAFDASIARVHARVWADLTTSGLMVGANDLIIASTALAHGLTLFTDNLKDFKRIPGLIIRQPDWSKVT